MAQEFGAAQPIIDVVKKMKDKAADYITGGPVKRALPKNKTKQDTSWHDKQVSEANESFRKNAVAKTGETAKTPVQRKTTKKAPPKRVASKR